MNTKNADDVRELQTYLRTLSQEYPGIPELAIDGVFGPQTAGAVLEWQRLCGAPLTGEVDGNTWEKLVEEYRRLCDLKTAAQPLYPFPSGGCVWEIGDEGPAIAILQAALTTVAQQCAFRAAPPVTGVFDEETAGAVKWLQKVCGFEQTGRVDRRTWDMLACTYNAYVDR